MALFQRNQGLEATFGRSMSHSPDLHRGVEGLSRKIGPPCRSNEIMKADGSNTSSFSRQTGQPGTTWIEHRTSPNCAKSKGENARMRPLFIIFRSRET